MSFFLLKCKKTIYTRLFSGRQNPERNPEPGRKPAFSNSQSGNRPETRPFAELWVQLGAKELKVVIIHHEIIIIILYKL